MDPVTLLAIGLGAGLVQVAEKLGEMVIEPALEPAQELLKKRIQQADIARQKRMTNCVLRCRRR